MPLGCQYPPHITCKFEGGVVMHTYKWEQQNATDNVVVNQLSPLCMVVVVVGGGGFKMSQKMN